MKLKKGTYNFVDISIDTDLTDKTLIYRFKTSKEDQTIPLLKGNVNITEITSTKSTGYIELDLSNTSALAVIEGTAYIDFKIVNNSDPTKPTYTQIFTVNIETTLKP
jgi:hypothetical protein